MPDPCARLVLVRYAQPAYRQARYTCRRVKNVLLAFRSYVVLLRPPRSNQRGPKPWDFLLLLPRRCFLLHFVSSQLVGETYLSVGCNGSGFERRWAVISGENRRHGSVEAGNGRLGLVLRTRCCQHMEATAMESPKTSPENGEASAIEIRLSTGEFFMSLDSAT